MARRFFDPEGFPWKPLGCLGDLVILSLLWVVCSLLLLTAGPATAALYDCVVHCVRRKETDLLGRFFRTFRNELKVGALSALLWLVLLGLPIFLFTRFGGALAGTAAALPLTIAYLLLLFFLFAVLVWVFPTLSRFAFGVAGLNRTALRLALGGILRSVAMALIVLLGAAACYRFIVPLFFLPALLALLCSFFIEPVFQRYTGAGAA